MNYQKIGLIIKKEYTRRVMKRSFLILTLLTPLLIVCIIAIPLWLSTIKNDQAKTIAIVDSTGKYETLFEDNENYHFISLKGDWAKYQTKKNKVIYAFLAIDADLLQQPDRVVIYADTQITTDLKNYITSRLEQHLKDEKLASYNIPHLKSIIQESQLKLNIKTIIKSEDGTTQRGSAEFATIIGLISTLVIYMFIILYGAMVMRGVMEEKTSRIVEVLVSSIKPIELMMGKIIGIAMVGLTQFLFWVVLTSGILSLAGLFLGYNQLTELAINTQTHQASNIDPKLLDALQMIQGINLGEIITLFVLYFLGGYLLYASLFAAVGSAVDNETDTQQFMLPITIPIIFALYAGIYSAQNPDGPLAFWCSIIPFTSPIVMMVRLPFDVPIWQIALSLSILILSFIGTTSLAAKIYRTGILMYGKKITYKELWKWLKY